MIRVLLSKQWNDYFTNSNHLGTLNSGSFDQSIDSSEITKKSETEV